ncbi:hypothetical protein GmHk_18G050776 [Glycine max]|nr:hypothetical protein GmHk_18G050776 [Glycine max]
MRTHTLSILRTSSTASSTSTMSPMAATTFRIWCVLHAVSGKPQQLTHVNLYPMRSLGLHFCREWNGVAPPSFSSSIICFAPSSVRPSNNTISAPIYFSDTSVLISQYKSSSTLSNIAKIFNLPTHASFARFATDSEMSRYTDDHDPPLLPQTLLTILLEPALLLVLATTSAYDPWCIVEFGYAGQGATFSFCTSLATFLASEFVFATLFLPNFGILRILHTFESHEPVPPAMLVPILRNEDLPYNTEQFEMMPWVFLRRVIRESNLVDTATRSKAPVEARREPTHTVAYSRPAQDINGHIKAPYAPA